MRSAGYVACLVGVLAMVAGRFAPAAPSWLVWAGLAAIALGWVLFAWSRLKRPGVNV